MGRVVTKRHVREGSTGIKLSEMIIIITVIAMLVAGGRYYFFVYRKSPAYALGEYLGAIKAGNVARQYVLIDDDDKQHFFPTEKDYASKAQQAHGYTERISGVTLSKEQPVPNKPHIVTIDASVSIRKMGQQIYQAGSDNFTDHYTLRKDSDGNWKVWLGRSKLNILTAPPNPPGDSFSNG